MSAERTALQRLCQLVFEPPPDLKVWEWAEQFRRLGKDVTAVPGRYRTDAAPYQREPQESFTASEVQTTVLLWSHPRSCERGPVEASPSRTTSASSTTCS